MSILEVIGLIASIVTIIIFVTGKTNLKSFSPNIKLQEINQNTILHGFSIAFFGFYTYLNFNNGSYVWGTFTVIMTIVALINFIGSAFR